MKPGKLYLKIFFSFLVILVITEALIFALFVLSPGRHFRTRFERFARGQVLLAKELIQEKILTRPKRPVPENGPLRAAISRLGDIYGAKVWLTAGDGTILLKSFEGDPTVNTEAVSRRHVHHFEDFRIYGGFKKKWAYYAVFPVQLLEKDGGEVHLFFEKQKEAHPEGRFALGLLIIGLIIALLMIPVSRLVTVRIKRLRESVHRIAEGDLSHRVGVKGRDEIAALARAFNRMTDRLERMIRGSRELTANVSHELRSPLTRIRVAMEILNRNTDPAKGEDIRRLLKGMGEDMEELDHLIEQILVLSKLDLHEAPLKLEILRPKAFIEEILEKYGSTLSQRNLVLKTEFLGDDACCMDKEAFRTAFINIFDNAVKFTPDRGKVTVRIHVAHQRLDIHVTNSHPPLNPEALDRIFEPFFRSRDSDIRGTGLGLAITRKIIERHGGTINARNTPEGLRVHLTLPPGPKA